MYSIKFHGFTTLKIPIEFDYSKNQVHTHWDQAVQDLDSLRKLQQQMHQWFQTQEQEKAFAAPLIVLKQNFNKFIKLKKKIKYIKMTFSLII